MKRSRAPSVEIVARYGAVVIDCSQVDETRRIYEIGEGPGARVPIAVRGVDRHGCLPLVRMCEDGPWLNAPGGAGIQLRVGKAGTAGDTAHASPFRLVEGMRVELVVGSVTFEIRVSEGAPPARFGRNYDRLLWLSQSASLALCLIFIVTLEYCRFDGTAPVWEDPEIQARLVRYLSARAPSIESVGAQEPPETELPGKGPPRASTPRPVRDRISERLTDVKRALRGVATTLAATPPGSALARGSEWASAARRLPEKIAGLELAETWRGGGGTAMSVVDLDLAWLTGGAKRRPSRPRREGEAFASRTPVRARESSLRDSARASEVNRDLIQGVIRRRSTDVQQCFRASLGRVTRVGVEFLIEADGHVGTVSIVRMSPADDGLAQCLKRTVNSWRFPALVAAAGAATVRHEFVEE